MKTQAEYIGEVFLHVGKLTTEAEKINYLREVQTGALLQLLEYAYNDKYTSSYKEIPKYKTDDSPIGLSVSGLHREYKRLSYFLNTNNYIKSDSIRNKKLKNILEIIPWIETSILENIILKKPLPHISKELAEKAFVGIFDNGEANGSKLP